MASTTGNPNGRPSIYTPELADRICELISINNCGLDKICDDNPELPNQSTIRAWRFTHQDFSAKYLQAKKNQAELYAEETFQIAAEKPYYTVDKGNTKIDAGYVAWQKLNVNLRQWHASKLAPKIYGDQKQVEDLLEDKNRLKQELADLKAELDAKNKKDY
jgi:deferrochelatase/peroxidase EfeB